MSSTASNKRLLRAKYLLVLITILLGPTLIAQTKAAKTVLILGNSIVHHEPAPHLGWNGDWGMAATAADSDFVHILIRRIRTVSPAAQVNYLNISAFERNYTTYNLSTLDTLRNPDIIIVKLSENVNDYTALQANFISYYSRLLAYLDSNNRAKRIIVEGFWQAPHISRVLKNYAAYNHYPFVPLSDLYSDPSNTAAGIFANPGVAMHPSNKGMRLIAERIWHALQPIL